MGFLTGMTKAYLNSWGQKIKEEERYLKSKERIEDMRSEGRKPYKSDLERVKDYEYVDNSPPEWIRKEYWIGEVGSYYLDAATDWFNKRRCE